MIELIASALRLSTPLLFAAMGGLLCERSGIATICLEGVMLVGAWTAATCTYLSGSPEVGLVCGVLAGAAMMGVHAVLCLTTRADAIISGVAVNLLAAGLTPLLTKAFFGSPTNTASLALDDRLSAGFFMAAALLVPFVLHRFMYRTGKGLHLLAAGDSPKALETAGVSAATVRWKALLLGGAICSMGGVYLAISHASQFTRDMTAGRGFIALTAVIFGKWRPLPAMAACLFFGFFDALQIRLQSTEIAGVALPVQFIQALPYIVALVVLAGFIGKATPPLAIGKSDTQ